jgi:hypothetical protein
LVIAGLALPVEIQQALRVDRIPSMTSSAADFVTVDMRHLKAGLVERARMDGVSVSAWVRGAVAARLGLADASEPTTSDALHAKQHVVRLSVRVSSTEAQRFEANAAVAGLSRGSYLAVLMSGVHPSNAAERSALTAAIVASNREVSALNRNVRHLTELLSRGSVRAAQEYRATLDSLAADVRRHLVLVGRGLGVLLAGSRHRPLAGEFEKELP